MVTHWAPATTRGIGDENYGKSFARCAYPGCKWTSPLFDDWDTAAAFGAANHAFDDGRPGVEYFTGRVVQPWEESLPVKERMKIRFGPSAQVL